MTKALDKASFAKFRNVAMNCNSDLRGSLTKAVESVHGEAQLLVSRLLRRV